MKIYIALVVIILAALIGTLAFKKATSPTAKINSHEFSLILAKDDKDKQIGLSRFSKIDKNKGMLFLFEKPDFYPFWMKDMKFPIDIIFIKDDKIVTIYGEVPIPKDKNNLIIYTPTEASDKVLEVGAQTSTKYNFKIGDTVTFKKRPMTILGIETSCDETSASLVEEKNGKLKILSNVVASSLPLHAKTGGIVPEVASREQIKFIIPVLKEAMVSDFGAIAVTYGPGLIGSLLVGVETAKTLSYIFKKPLIPVNHLVGHIYANWLDNTEEVEFPALSLIVSGGHTDLFIIREHKKIEWIGGTRDDAAGEAFDKIGRLLGLPYPGGPYIEEAAKAGKDMFNFPRPMTNSKDFDFSFSGLKTAVLREVKDKTLNKKLVSDISASVQNAVVDVLVAKTLKAAEKFKVKSVLLGGGVAANQRLRDNLKNKLGEKLFIPPKNLCTDNGAMIAGAAFYNFQPKAWQEISANPQLSFA